MNDLLGWLIVGLTLAAGCGWAWRLLRETGWLTALLGLAISVGALTLIMLWQGLLGIPLTLATTALPFFALMLPGWWRVQLSRPRLPEQREKQFALIILLAVCGAILFNGAYLPFYRADTLGIYLPAAREIYETQALVPLTGADSLYRAYPILIPLSYSYAFAAAGWQNEYLAKTIATILSAACVPATFVLGRQFRDARTGWLAALLLALTPFFSRWASSGYVDLPMAFFYTLAAVFALRLWRAGGGVDAALAGVMIGLAAWTKNAALIGVPLLGMWLAWALLNRRIGWRAALTSAAACAAVAAPWYARNLIGTGFVMPDTAWTDQAQRTLESLFAFASRPQNFGLPGLVILLGLAAALPALLRREAGAVLLTLWTLPFFAAWWLFASYDPRFLLLFLPPLCVLAGDALARLRDRIGKGWKPGYTLALGLVVIVLAAQVTWNAVEYKPAILGNLWMSHDAKLELVGRE